MLMRLASGAGLLLVLYACSPRNDVETAEKAVAAFRKESAAAQFEQIYQAADSDFQSTASLKDFVQYERLVETKLGAFISTELTNYNVVYVLGKSEVRLDYQSRFKNGDASETFTVKVKDATAIISGYRIDSPLLPKAH